MLSRVLTRPVMELTEVTARMAGGDLTQKVRITTGDEIGTLANSFNRMADQVLSYTRNLEEIVQDRTEEIQEKEEKYRNLSNLLNSVLESSTEYSIIATDTQRDDPGVQQRFSQSLRVDQRRSHGKDADRSKLSARMVARAGSSRKFPVRWKPKGMTEYELERIRKDGTLFQAHAIVTTLKDASGKTLGFLEIARDITEKLALEKELRETKDYLENIVQSSVDAIVTTDPKGRITFVNRAMEEMVGLSRDQITSLRISQLYVNGLGRSPQDHGHPAGKRQPEELRNGHDPERTGGSDSHLGLPAKG